MADYEKAFGQNLRAFRTAAGLTQQQVADYTGSRQTYVSNVETGNVTLTLNSALRIASALGVHLDTLIGCDDGRSATDAAQRFAALDRELRQLVAKRVQWWVDGGDRA